MEKRELDRMMKPALEFVGEALTIAAIALLARLYLMFTPSQMSGEYDWALEEGRAAGVAD